MCSSVWRLYIGKYDILLSYLPVHVHCCVISQFHQLVNSSTRHFLTCQQHAHHIQMTLRNIQVRKSDAVF